MQKKAIAQLQMCALPCTGRMLSFSVSLTEKGEIGHSILQQMPDDED